MDKKGKGKVCEDYSDVSADGIPAESFEVVVRRMTETLTHCSYLEICAMLLECHENETEATNRLLSQGAVDDYFTSNEVQETVREETLNPVKSVPVEGQAVQVIPEQLTFEELNPDSLIIKTIRCNCKKSKCLKLYCECFAAGNYCTEPCSCVECFNKPIHEDTVLATRKQIESKNSLAFNPKVIRDSDDAARHIRGCNCKKSNCLRNYCECYKSGVGCSINCRCEGCENQFGRKEG